MRKIGTLYLVDDDDVFKFLANKVITETKLVRQIKMFFNGFDALEFLKSVQDKPDKLPDVILLDLTMPVMDGWSFLNEYISLKPNLGKAITIYIVTSSIDPADIDRAKSISDVTDYIIKPVTKEKFEDIIRSIN
jgi:CheY-like chemotaxis protein